MTPAGAVEHGITDPVTGQFFQNGVKITLANGTDLYGYMDGKDFYSGDGTTIVLQNGTVLTGTLDQNTGYFTASNGSDYFLSQNGIVPASDVIDGQTVRGTYGTDGSFLSQDGTIYVTPDGQVEHGITDPVTGQFFQNGVKITLANGTDLYGYMDGKDFYSGDGTTIVLQNGTVLTGTLDQNTGIFTASNGTYDFIGQNGIVPVTLQSDGSFHTPDGSIIMTPQAWSVDLPQLHDAIGQVSAQRDLIQGQYLNIQTTFNAIEERWQSPAGSTFVAARVNFNMVFQNVMDVLDEAIDRMSTSYQNYVTTETTNTQNLH